MKNKTSILILFLLSISSLHATTEKDLTDTLELAKAKEALLNSLDALDKRVSNLENIANAVQISERQKALKLLSEVRDRKKLIEQGEYVAIEDLTVRASELESDIYNAMQQEAIQQINTHPRPEYTEINYMLQEALNKKDLTALRDALLIYRFELENTDSGQQKRLDEFQKSQTWMRRYTSLIVIVVLISSIISYTVFQKSAKSKRDSETIESFLRQAASNPSSVSKSLVEDPAVQQHLSRRISDEERRILGE